MFHLTKIGLDYLRFFFENPPRCTLHARVCTRESFRMWWFYKMGKSPGVRMRYMFIKKKKTNRYE